MFSNRRQSRGTRGDRANSHSSHMRSRKGAYNPNQFHNTIHNIAHRHGLNSTNIISKVEDLSSADFCLGISQNALDVLPQIIVNELRSEYDLHNYAPFRFQPSYHSHSHSTSRWRFNESACDEVLVFISNSLTERLLSQQIIAQCFQNASRLYQYLNWTFRITKMVQTAVVYRGRRRSQNNCSIHLIHTELRNHHGEYLYALCIPNDVDTYKAQKWQLAALLTARELEESLKIDTETLPLGVRSISRQFSEYRYLHRRWGQKGALKAMKHGILRRHRYSKSVRYQQMKCVQTNGRRQCNVLEIRLSTLHRMVRSALEDDTISLVPMVSIVLRRRKNRRIKDFSVDYLLPVQIGETPDSQTWIGVVYRKEVPTQALMDHYDIVNKAILCNPSFDATKVNMFQNQRWDRLRVLSDDQPIDDAVKLNHKSIDQNEYIDTQCDTQCGSHSHDVEGYGLGFDTTETPETPETPYTPETPECIAVSACAVTPDTPSSSPSLLHHDVVSPTINISPLPPMSSNNSFPPTFNDGESSPSSVSVMAPPLLNPITALTAGTPGGDPLLLPMPMMAVPPDECPEPDQLMEWIGFILNNGEHNVTQFQQYLPLQTMELMEGAV